MTSKRDPDGIMAAETTNVAIWREFFTAALTGSAAQESGDAHSVVWFAAKVADEALAKWMDIVRGKDEDE